MMPLPKGSSIMTRSRWAITTWAMPTIFLSGHGVANDGEGFLADAVVGREILGRVAVPVVDAGFRNEAVDVDRVRALDSDAQRQMQKRPLCRRRLQRLVGRRS